MSPSNAHLVLSFFTFQGLYIGTVIIFIFKSNIQNRKEFQMELEEQIGRKTFIITYVLKNADCLYVTITD
jgi:hypothetical protein